MNFFRPNLKLGLFAAGATVVGLILIPPLIAPYLEEWQVAKVELPLLLDVHEACGPKGVVTLSRWFYSFNVTGSIGNAKFNGSVETSTCHKKFVVELEQKNYLWRISRLTWKK